MAGYDVWCDANKLLGGEDFWQEIERTLRKDTIKFLIVISSNAYSDSNMLRDGIAKELALAEIVRKQSSDTNFIIPLRLDDTNYGDFTIELIRTNGIDCSVNWAAGLAKLLKALERDAVPKSNTASQSLTAWRQVHQHHTRAISDQTETLQSNWLPILSLPETLYFYQAPEGVRWSAEPRVIASQSRLPSFAHGRLLAAFASRQEMQEAVGAQYPLRDRGQLPLSNYLRGWTDDILGVAPHDARNQISSLIRQAWDLRMRRLGLWDYELANGQLAWWFPTDLPKDGQLRFSDFNGKVRKRASTGIKGQKESPAGESVPRNYWHLGFTAQPMLGEESVIKLRSRIILTDDGKVPVANKTRLNSLRRSLTKMWFNDKWRGLVLGFANFVAEGADQIALPVSSQESIFIAPDVISFKVDKGIASDPVNENLSDELAETYDREEQDLRLSDPVFSSLIDDEEDNDG